MSAGPIAASRTTPSTVPSTLPVPPVTEAPPTTTDAITFISRPMPALLGIWLKRTALSTAASPVSAPRIANASHFTADVFEAGQPRGTGVRAGRIDRAAGGEVAQSPGERRRQRRRRRGRDQRELGLRQPEPLKARGRSCTQAPSVAQRSPSRSAIIVASVTTIDGMPT